MGIFSRKSTGSGSGDNADKGNNGAPSGGGQPEFSPHKAQAFFDRASVTHDTGQHEYAMSLWLSGLRLDPLSTSGLEGFFKSAGAYMNSGGKGTPKDVARSVDGKSDVEKYLRTLLEWGVHPHEAPYAVRAVEAATTLGLPGPTLWLGERAMVIAARDKRVRKEHFLTLMESFRKFESFERAVMAGEAALRVDPADAKLGALIRNISAESTMSKGGFDQTGQSGGFRANIRDASKQQHLEEEERIVKTEETLERLIEQARAAHEANPQDRPAIKKYIDRLLERGSADDEQIASKVAQEAFRQTQEFRFEEEADKIRLRQARRPLVKLKQAADAAANDESGEEARRRFKAAAREYVELEAEVLEKQVKQYPTDLARKYELGKRYFQLGRFEDTIGQLQEAKADVKNRAPILNLLAKSFHQIDWLDEAVQTHKQAIESVTDQGEQVIRDFHYDLLLSLEARARERMAGEAAALNDAEEAYKIASSIAIQQINYKDIRQRREELKKLIAELRATPAG
ncbi:MAG: hypothetical protein KF768_00200 [Phycisphaeraceae bacterium]|nr:hypothetical protein [Phycisphaeraceae bacterium]